MPNNGIGAQKQYVVAYHLYKNAARINAVEADSRRAQRDLEERRVCPTFRPEDWGIFPQKPGRKSTRFIEMTARPPVSCYK